LVEKRFNKKEILKSRKNKIEKGDNPPYFIVMITKEVMRTIKMYIPKTP